MNYNDALKIVQAGRVGDVKDLAELRAGLSAMHLYYANYRDHSMKAAIDSFENEISRRLLLAASTALHQEQMAQGGKNHEELISQQERLHQKHIEATKDLHCESSIEGKTQHKQSLHIERWILGFAIATFVVATLAYVHDLQNSHSTTEPLAPPLSGMSAPTATQSVLTIAPTTNSVSKTNLPAPQAAKQPIPLK